MTDEETTADDEKGLTAKKISKIFKFVGLDL